MTEDEHISKYPRIFTSRYRNRLIFFLKHVEFQLKDPTSWSDHRARISHESSKSMVTLSKFGYLGNHQAGYFGEFWTKIELHTEWSVTFKAVLVARICFCHVRDLQRRENLIVQLFREAWMLLLMFTAVNIHNRRNESTFVCVLLGPSSHRRHGWRTIPGEVCFFFFGGGVRTGKKIKRSWGAVIPDCGFTKLLETPIVKPKM